MYSLKRSNIFINSLNIQNSVYHLLADAQPVPQQRDSTCPVTTKKHQCVINIVLTLKPKQNTVSSTRRKIN